MGLSEIYQGLEDKWYGFLDKLDEKIPVYDVIDPIDKIIPSFVFFIVLILAIIAGIALLLLPSEPIGDVSVAIFIEDSSRNPIPGLSANFSFNEFSLDKTSNPDGKIELKLDLETVLTISVNNPQYQSFEKTIVIDSNPFDYTITLYELDEEAPTFITRTIMLTDNEGRSLRGVNATITFSCTNPEATPPRGITTDTGQVTIEEPSNCGTLLVSVNADGLDPVDNIPVDNDDPPIIVVPPIGGGDDFDNPLYGTLEVNVRDSDGPLDDITVKLLDRYDSVIDTEDTWVGFAPFYSVLPGTYSLDVSNPDSLHFPESISNVIIVAGEVTSINVTLTKIDEDLGGDDGDDNEDDALDDDTVNDGIVHFITVEVISSDSSSPERIANATVKIRDNNNKVIPGGEKSTGNNAEQLFFIVTRDVNYSVFARADGFVSAPRDYNVLIDQNVIIELTPDNPDAPINSGNIKVIVKDEGSRLMASARVSLFEEDAEFSDWQEVTNSKGEALFTGLSEGSYYAKAYNELSTGSTEENPVDVVLGETINLPLTIFIGNIDIHLTIVDEDGNPIPLAEVEVWRQYDDSDEARIGTWKANEQGVIERTIKAGKTIYFVASAPMAPAPGFGSTTVSTPSNQTPLLPNTTLTQVIVLNRIILSENPVVELVESSLPEFLEDGKRYNAEIKLSIPQNENFIRGGIHFRVGKDSETPVQNSPLIIESVTPGGTPTIIRGETFGLSDDEENITNDDAKWVNIIWEDVEAGRTYTATIELSVRSLTPNGTELQVFYRGWGEEENSVFFRDPVDVTPRKPLNANTYSKLYLEGTTPVCDSRGIVCSGEDKILDIEQDLYLYRDSFTSPGLKNNGSFAYEFSLYNLSNAFLGGGNTKPKLELRNVFSRNGELYGSIDSTSESPLILTGYNIKNADGLELSERGLDLREITEIQLGDFNPNTRIDGNLLFDTQFAGPTNIQLRVIDERSVVFDSLTQLTVMASDTLQVETNLDNGLTAFAENTVVVTVTNQNNQPVRDARVKFTKIKDNFSTVLVDDLFTAPNGTVTYTITESGNDYDVVISATKLDFNPGETTLTAHTEIVDIVPSSVSKNLNTIFPREVWEEFSFENLTGQIELHISSIEFSDTRSNVFRYLDKGRMQSHVNQFLFEDNPRFQFLPNAPIADEEFFKMILNNSADFKPGAFTGYMTVKVASNDVLGEWTQTPILFTANISVGGSIQSQGCLSVNGSSWVSSVSDTGDTSVQFTLTNGCQSSINDDPLELKDLQFKLEYLPGSEEEPTTEKGDLTLKVDGFPAELRKNSWRINRRTVERDASHNLTLTFNPRQGEGGKKLHARLFVDAKNPSNNEFVNNEEAVIDIEIDIVNLEECFDYSIVTDSGSEDVGDTEEFTILEDASNIKLELRNKCESSIEVQVCNEQETINGSCGVRGPNGLEPKPQKLTIPKNETKSFNLNNPTIPGAFSINIDARKKQNELFRLIKIIRINVDKELFADNPFVQVEPLGEKTLTYFASVNIYNKEIGSEGSLKYTPTEFNYDNPKTWIALTPSVTDFGEGGSRDLAYGSGAFLAGGLTYIALSASAVFNPIGTLVWAGITATLSVAFPASNIWYKYWQPEIYSLTETQIPTATTPRIVSLTVNSGNQIKTFNTFLVNNTSTYALSSLISPTNATIPSGISQTFTANSLGGTGSYSYKWELSSNSNCTSSGATSNTFSVSCTNDSSQRISRTIKLIATSGTQTKKLQTILYILPSSSSSTALLNGNISPNNPVTSLGESQTFNAAVSGGNNSYSYAWNIDSFLGCESNGESFSSFGVVCSTPESNPANRGLLLPTEEMPINVSFINSDSRQKIVETSLYDLTGDRYRRRIRAERHIWGQGNEDYPQGDARMSLNVVCPDQFVLEDQADYADNVVLGAPSIWTSRTDREDDDCWFDGLISPNATENSKYTGAKNWSGNDVQAQFTAHCDGRRFHDFELNYDVYATCKYKNWDQEPGGETGKAFINLNISNQSMISDISSGKPVYVTLDLIGKDTIYGGPPAGYPDIDFGSIRLELTKKQKQRLPDRDLEPAVCETGTTTGESQLPKIGLTKNIGWNFDDIDIDTCAQTDTATDLENDDYIYCDATQFSISLLKRINALQQFLSDNDNSFACPDNPLTVSETTLEITGTNDNIVQTIALNDFGIERVDFQTFFDDNDVRTVRALISVKNNFSTAKKLGLRANLVNSNANYNQECTNQQWLGVFDAQNQQVGETPQPVNWSLNYWPARDGNALFRQSMFRDVSFNNYNPNNEDATNEGFALIQCDFKNVVESDNYTLNVALKKFNNFSVVPNDVENKFDVCGNSNGTNYEDGTCIASSDKNAGFQTKTFFPRFNLVEHEPENAEGTFCYLTSSTEENGGTFIPRLWLDNENRIFGEFVNEIDVDWDSVPGRSLDGLYRLTHFNALLIKDAYSQDFINDLDFYLKNSFPPAADWYVNRNTGLGRIFSNPNRTRFEILDNPNGSRLVNPGQYKVDIDVIFEQGNEWEFFSGGNPKARIIVTLKHLALPKDVCSGENECDRDSAFYYLPFNGRNGLQGEALERNGYGVAYATGTQIKINEDSNPTTLAETLADAGSNALFQVETEKIEDTEILNSTLNSRGEILRIEDTDSVGLNKRISFRPSLATPVLLKVNDDSLQSPLSVFYRFSENGSFIETGENLSYWNGINELQCKDFSGNYVWDEFRERADASAIAEDGVPIESYKLVWDRLNRQGSVWLSSVFFTPAAKTNELSIYDPISQASFISPSNLTGSQIVSLTGVQGMKLNSSSNTINSIEDVFELVKNRQACISDDSIRAQFFWSEKAVMQANKDFNLLINSISPSASAPNTCIA